MAYFAENLGLGFVGKDKETRRKLQLLILQEGKWMEGYTDGICANYHMGDAQFVLSAVYDKENDAYRVHDIDTHIAGICEWNVLLSDINLNDEEENSLKKRCIVRDSETGEKFTVSTFRLRTMDLAYFSDYRDEAGIWGYINESGEQIIAPQYIYANDFENGVAIVAKGKWTKDPKWNNEYNKDRYWTEYEIWGGIDKNGNEVIPFIFDEIKHLFDRKDIYMAHYGGWNDGKWGIIDNNGNWLAPPIFEKIDYCSKDNLIAFYNEDYWEVDDALCGIYDLNEKKVVLAPQFKDVIFLDNGDLCVEVYDEELGRDIEKIIDLTGRERFSSTYTYISTWKHPYEVMIREGDENRHGLIDNCGNTILPCIYKLPKHSNMSVDGSFVFEENGKQGVMGDDGKLIIPAVYNYLHKNCTPFYEISENGKNGLIDCNGNMVLPMVYTEIRTLSDRKHFLAKTDDCWHMFCIREK